MSRNAYDWPRLYLLNLYREAVERGHIIVEGIEQDKAESLKMSLYRLRRRSDKSNASIILPEYHLVTCGEWKPYIDGHFQPEASHIGTMSILYNSIPNGTLPTIRDATTGQALPTIAERSHQPLHLGILPSTDPVPSDMLAALSQADHEVQPADISDYVAKLRSKAASHD